MTKLLALAMAMGVACIGSHSDQKREEIVLADFEQADYGAWKTTGEAFGPGPAQGTLPNQMPVSGFLGHGLLNSYHHGDGSTGTLTSPEFKIDRKYLNFLIGGGNHPGECSINLLVGGKIERSATGRDSEHLDWRTWDVEDLHGKTAVIEIVDKHKGGWGHINVDQIVLSDERKAEEIKTAPLYEETYRPQFHFTPQKGWTNDPNGLVYYAGEYHLFFQHNPFGTQWGNMTWGHAVSKDLLHWKQLPNALEPDKLGTMFSGSAVVDWNNTAGFQTGKEKTLVAIYTAAGGTSDASKGQPFTQCIAYSNDKGRTWTKYSGNPVLKNVIKENRDPKVVWHAPTKRWIMALYLDGNEYALFRSPNLKDWELLHKIEMPGCSECPDFFEISVDREEGKKKWVFTAANGKYFVGDFDGSRFTPDPGGPFQVEYGGNCYAVQTYSDIPAKDGRRIQIGWMNGGVYPEMPFNQQMTIPCELTLRRTHGGLRLTKVPVKEIELIREKELQKYDAFELKEGFYAQLSNEEFSPRPPGWPVELRLDIRPVTARKFSVRVCGLNVTYDFKDESLSALGKTVMLKPDNGVIRLHILADRTSLEVFGNDGQVALSSCYVPQQERYLLNLGSIGGATKVENLKRYWLRSIWK